MPADDQLPMFWYPNDLFFKKDLTTKRLGDIIGSSINAKVAQLVEHSTENAGVVGSIPSLGTTGYKPNEQVNTARFLLSQRPVIDVSSSEHPSDFVNASAPPVGR